MPVDSRLAKMVVLRSLGEKISQNLPPPFGLFLGPGGRLGKEGTDENERDRRNHPGDQGVAPRLVSPVDLGEAVLVALDAMAADAHFGLLLARFSRAGHALRLGSRHSRKKGRSGDNGTGDRGQQLVHFASTMRWTIDKNQWAII